MCRAGDRQAKHFAEYWLMVSRVGHHGLDRALMFFDGLWIEPVMCDVSHIFLYGMYTCIPSSITMEVKTHSSIHLLRKCFTVLGLKKSLVAKHFLNEYLEPCICFFIT